MREYLDGTSHLVTWICLHRQLGAVTRQGARPGIDPLVAGMEVFWCASVEYECVEFSVDVTANAAAEVTVMVMLLLTASTRELEGDVRREAERDWIEATPPWLLRIAIVSRLVAL